MIRYNHDFAYPMQWDDFYPEDRSAGYPKFTLMTASEYDDGADGDLIGFDEESGWWNIVVVESEITADVARGVIAATIGVSPDQIELSNDGRIWPV